MNCFPLLYIRLEQMFQKWSLWSHIIEKDINARQENIMAVAP